MLDAELLEDWLTRSRNSDVNLLDIVWEADSNGDYQLAHMHSSRWDDIETEAGVVDGMWTDAREGAIRTVLKDAPAYSPTAIRLTVVLSQYLPSSKRALNAVATVGDTWDAAPVVASVQNGAWYIICGIKNEDACNRPAIKGSDADVLTNTYLAELDGYGEVAEGLCSSDRFTCFYATDAYVSNMGALVEPAMDWLATKPWIHAINYYGLGQKKPDDINRAWTGSPPAPFVRASILDRLGLRAAYGRWSESHAGRWPRLALSQPHVGADDDERADAAAPNRLADVRAAERDDRVVLRLDAP